MAEGFADGVKVLVPTGSLGAGVREDEVAYGLTRGAHAIACDAGSTDSGAAYLATGKSKNNRGAVKRDLSILMKAYADTGIPIIVGTAGQAGGDLNLDWTRDIVLELADELGLSPRIALLRSEQSRETVKRLNAAGRIKPLPPLGALEDATIDACDHIVAALGVEPYVAALEAGADIVLGGRSTDTAVLAAYPIWKGAPWGPAWHAGKIGECGAQCTEERESSGVLLTVRSDSFEVEPLSEANRCTPESVSAHMLYENTDPFRLVEPGGVLDVGEARYVQNDERTVRVAGSAWEPRPYTMKLEGAGRGQYQTLMLVGIQDPDVLRDVESFHDRLLAALYQRTRSAIPAEELGEFHISLRMYGWNGVTGMPVAPGTPPPPEIGMLFVATAATQELANSIAHACNPYFFHYPSVMDKELPSYGFAFSPADVPRGPVYEFRLNHVVEVDDWRELVRIEWAEPSSSAHAATAETAHG
ncbi:acyclic terpene utilization AtuA family protein [Pelagerythrobacter rhizovicinus]|uniref:Acyclic terpene utilization AtuA family protein n=1 Tax=Pelagerythrobacter rhizovicinus TaxID=2268576 RepID=A0A4Q2KP29_9SPHN|nr:acyclic terpene utilization AtuA family protein [Pelagerythrobacter rhizovicinus]RXZ64981.1 acyclic terpene utilization AtuA family protein [Pelagerythrobacter rhizovicinus]